MKVRVTSIAWDDVSEMVRSFTTELENWLTPIFQGVTFGAGVTQLTIVLISAASDQEENKRLCKGYDKVGKLRNPLTNGPVKYIGLAVPVSSDVLVGLDQPSLRRVICPLLIEKIAEPNFRIPKDFEYEAFSQLLSGAAKKFCSMVVS